MHPTLALGHAYFMNIWLRPVQPVQSKSCPNIPAWSHRLYFSCVSSPLEGSRPDLPVFETAVRNVRDHCLRSSINGYDSFFALARREKGFSHEAHRPASQSPRRGGLTLRKGKVRYKRLSLSLISSAQPTTGIISTGSGDDENGERLRLTALFRSVRRVSGGWADAEERDGSCSPWTWAVCTILGLPVDCLLAVFVGAVCGAYSHI